MEIKLKLFPKEWLSDLYQAIEKNMNKCKILHEVHISDKYVQIDVQVEDEFSLIMLGVWIGHIQIERVVEEAKPKVIENITNLVNYSITNTSEN